MITKIVKQIGLAVMGKHVCTELLRLSWKVQEWKMIVIFISIAVAPILLFGGCALKIASDGDDREMD